METPNRFATRARRLRQDAEQSIARRDAKRAALQALFAPVIARMQANPITITCSPDLFKGLAEKLAISSTKTSSTKTPAR